MATAKKKAPAKKKAAPKPAAPKAEPLRSFAELGSSLAGHQHGSHPGPAQGWGG